MVLSAEMSGEMSACVCVDIGPGMAVVKFTSVN